MERQSDDWLTGPLSTNTSTIPEFVETKVNRNLKIDGCANYNYETEETWLWPTLRRYLRFY